jgi:hypothetical protein
VDRHYGAAARQIQADRERRRKDQPIAPVIVLITNPAREPKQVSRVYAAFREALEHAGQPTAQMSRESFEKFLQHKVEQLRGHAHGEVEVVVSLESGKASLKARIRK